MARRLSLLIDGKPNVSQCCSTDSCLANSGSVVFFWHRPDTPSLFDPKRADSDGFILVTFMQHRAVSQCNYIHGARGSAAIRHRKRGIQKTKQHSAQGDSAIHSEPLTGLESLRGVHHRQTDRHGADGWGLISRVQLLLQSLTRSFFLLYNKDKQGNAQLVTVNKQRTSKTRAH
jgi:hypothetical protein